MADINKKQAILYGLVNEALTELMAKTNVENVVYSVGEDGTEVYLSTKLTEIIADIATRAKTDDVNTAIANLRTELMGEGVPEAYDTFKELADYIATHQEAADALTAAIGNKADKATVEAIQTTINGLGTLATLSEVGEDNLSADLKAKVNAAAEGNHAHANKTVLDGITEQIVAAWNAAEAKAHEHANKAELDKFVDGDKAKYDQAVTDLGTVSGKVDTLVGEDTGKSARTIANEELAKQLVPEGAKESLDTLAEISAWIQSHPDDASAMNAAIVALQNQLKGISAGDGTVKKYVDDAITALNAGDFALGADLTALAARVSTLESKVSSTVYVQSEQPASLKAGDLWVKIV